MLAAAASACNTIRCDAQLADLLEALCVHRTSETLAKTESQKMPVQTRIAMPERVA